MTTTTEEAITSSKKAQATLSQQANRNFLLSLVLFAVLIATVFVAFQQAKENMAALGKLYTDQVRLEQFKASLSNVLLPLNDFTLTQNKEDVSKLKKAEQEFQVLYSEIESLGSMTTANKKVLGQVFGLMREVTSIADDIVSEKIPFGQAGNVAVVAQNLVFVAQQKLEGVTSNLTGALKHASELRQAQIDKQSYIILAIIVFIILLLTWFNRAFVKKITSTISGVANNVAHAAGDIMNSVEQQAAAADTQAKSVEQIANELEHISDSARKIAATSLSVEKIAGATASSAGEGVQAVDDAIASMGTIRSEVNTIAEKVTFAGKKAEQILESIDAVQEIADETHLLALNASIESAAAGEFGKRFAVVASEVRRLADRTREFTEEIQAIVNDVHSSTQDSVEVTREGLTEVDKGVDIAQRAGEVLRRMQTMSDKTSQAVHTIAKATGRQNESNQDFLRAMKQISDLLHDSAKQMQASREASYQLTAAADDLQRLV